MTQRLIALLFISIIPLACEDVLTENPGTFLNEATIFSTEDGAVAATMGIYQQLRVENYYGTDFIRNIIHHSDYALGRGSMAPMANYQLDATNIGRIGNTWVAIYTSIYRANLVIQRVPGVPGIDPDLSDQLVGEASFLRALGYYNLVRGWGAVPLRLEPETEDFKIARSPESEVYAQIIDDLLLAEEVLPSEYPTNEIGRVTKWAAKTLLADVYLTLERWGDAAAKAKEVIDSGLFSLVRVATSEDFHKKMFGPDIPVHSEEVLSIKYNVLENNDGFVRHFHKPAANYSDGGSFGLYGNMDSFISKGEWADENSPDLRRNDFLYSGADVVHLDPVIKMLFRKFRGTPTNISNDLPLLRYAEALMIFAEAESQANGGPNAAAYDAINQIRRRAFGQDPAVAFPAADLPADLSATEFRDALMLERAKEFLGEGKRWFDLKRTGTALQVLQGLGFNIAERNLKWPIPVEEIDNNELLGPEDQNPGW